MSSFSPYKLRTLFALAQVVLPQNLLNQFSLEKVAFEKRMKLSYEPLAFNLKIAIQVSLWILQWRPFFTKFSTFTSLNIKKRKLYYSKIFKSSSFINYLLLRPLLVLIYTNYYADPEVATYLGYPENKEGQKVKIDFPKAILEVPEKDSEIDVDVCVIGSGAGGAVVAKELAEKGREVLILEEGTYFNQSHFQTLSTLERNKLMYREGGLSTTLGFPMALLPTGKAVGGTTIINSGTCYRTPDKILQKWSQKYGLNQFTSEFLKPYFEKVERIIQVKAVPDLVYSQNDLIMKKGADHLGYHVKPLHRNAEPCLGKGECIYGCPSGSKQSMELSYLPLAFKAGARLYHSCHVHKLHHHHGKVQSIEAIFQDPLTKQKKTRLTVKAKKVVVACGSLQTPLLLKRSGLQGESGQVGKNLTIHPTAKMIGLFDHIIDGHKGVPQGSEIQDFWDEGLMYESVFFPPWLLATSLYQNPDVHYEVMKNFRNVSIYGFLVHDEGHGRVIEGPKGQALVFYSINEKERQLFIKGLQILGEIFFKAGAKKVFPSLRSIHQLQSKKDLSLLNSKNIKRSDIESAAFHPLGTCRMGLNSKDSVVNAQLRHHQIENLWLTDGSVFPSSLGVNPQVSIMAFSTLASEQI